MPKKKKLTKEERREQRLSKARQWALTYKGSHIVWAYRKRFRLDYTCALKDMQAIGALSPEKFGNMKRAEEIRLQNKENKRSFNRSRRCMTVFPIPTTPFSLSLVIPPAAFPMASHGRKWAWNPMSFPKKWIINS